MKTPLVSVIVPCYNQAAFLPDALDSVLRQTYGNWECIIINDGSVDDSASVAAKWCAADSRFSCISLPNGGVSKARNIGIENSKGEFILPLDADDSISENYIAEMVNAFNEDHAVKVAYGPGEKFGLVNEKWDLSDFDMSWLIFSNMIHVSGLFLRNDWEEVGGYDTNMHEGLEDWEFWINILKRGGKVRKVDSAHFYYRVKEESRMTIISLQKRYRLLAYIYFKHSELYESYINDFSRPININFPFAFWLAGKTYFKEDTDRVKKLENYYKSKLRDDLKKLNFIQKKRILYYWYRRGKLNLSFWDVVTK